MKEIKKENEFESELDWMNDKKIGKEGKKKNKKGWKENKDWLKGKKERCR